MTFNVFVAAGVIVKPKYAQPLPSSSLSRAYHAFTMGDEIGMRFIDGLPNKEGSLLPKGNRAGSRTPMQWDATPGAGFSTANPDQYYLPIDSACESPQRSSTSQWSGFATQLRTSPTCFATRIPCPCLSGRNHLHANGYKPLSTCLRTAIRQVANVYWSVSIPPDEPSLRNENVGSLSVASLRFSLRATSSVSVTNAENCISTHRLYPLEVYQLQ